MGKQGWFSSAARVTTEYEEQFTCGAAMALVQYKPTASLYAKQTSGIPTDCSVNFVVCFEGIHMCIS